MRSEGKQRRDKGSSPPRKERNQAADADRAAIGWGLSAEEQEEKFFLRRVAFSVAVAVVGCMGAWILLTTLTDGSGPELKLSAQSASAQGRLVLTVVLREIDPAQAEAIQQLLSTDTIRALAKDNAFRFLELHGGSVAVCVGRADESGEAQLQQLARNFREFSTSGGARPFQGASIRRYRE